MKANFYTIGVNGRVQLNDCQAAKNTENHVDSILAYAQQAGKSTGIVTTTTVTHASPSANYAHSANRLFECDADVNHTGYNANDCQDIASQLIYNKPGNGINVIFGGGRTKFIPNTMKDVDNSDGEREDGKNLINDWTKHNPNAKVIFDKVGLDNLNVDDTEYVLGLFASSHMDFNLDANHTKQPRLLDMVEKAIHILQKEKNGFVLFVEGLFEFFFFLPFFSNE